MNDLISRAAAIKACAEKREVWYGNGPLPSNESLMWQAAISIIEKLAAVDAVPVVHAYWIDCSNGNDGTVCRKCSACKDMQIHYRTYYPNFCPECGAKMDGERRNSE